MSYNEKEIIKGCLKNSRKAQKVLYEKYVPLMYNVCIRYSHNRDEADDILQEGFIKIFAKIKQYSGQGSLAGWIKRVIINTAINYYKQNKKYHHQHSIDDYNEFNADEENIDTSNSDVDIKTLVSNADLSFEEIETAIKELPKGYQMIFNLYAIEKYKHKEIADMLNIKESTSRSQLNRARIILQERLKEISLAKLEKLV